MPVLTMPGKAAVRTAVFTPAIFRNLVAVLHIARRPLNMPRWAIAVLVAVLATGGFFMGRQRPAHHYVAYFGYPMVLDTTTGKACYAVAPRPAKAAAADDPAFPLDGTANQLDTQTTAGDQIPLCGTE